MNANGQFSNETSNSSTRSLWDYLNIFRKRKWTILTLFLITVASLTLKAFSIQPIYEGVTEVLIDKEKPKFLSLEEMYYSFDEAELETQYRILSSRTLAKTAFDKLNLDQDSAFANSSDPVGAFQSMFSIEPRRQSRIVLIKARHPVPEKAAFFANEFSRVYIEQNLQRKLDTARYSLDWLTQQLGSVREKVEQSELAIQNYIEANQIVNIPKIEEGNTKGGMLQELEASKAKLETELSEFSKRYKEKHPKMIRLQSALAAVNEKLDHEVKSVLDLNRRTMKYGILRREVESNRQLYDLILDKAKQTNLLEDIRVNNISIIDPAQVPGFPIYPNKRRTVMIACILGILIGCGIAFLLESLDNTVKGIEDAQKLTGLPILGSIPDTSHLKRKIKPDQIDIACHVAKQSPFSESYRFIRTGIFFSSVDKPTKTILMTSTCPKEGKTTDVINLAITLASSGEKVLLIDADLRNPRIHKVFGLKGDSGLSLVLTGEMQVNDAIQSTQIPNLFILPCGRIPPDPSELLESRKMKDFIGWARSNYAKVLIDSPPVMAVADPMILSSLVDGVLFVIRNGSTHRKQVTQALNKLSETQIKILGVLLNRVRASSDGYYYRYYSAEKRTKEERLAVSR